MGASEHCTLSFDPAPQPAGKDGRRQARGKEGEEKGKGMIVDEKEKGRR